MVFLYLVHGWDNRVLHKFLSLYTLQGDFSHNSKSAETTTSKIKQLWVLLFWNLYCSLGRSNQFQGNDLFINWRQSCTSTMCTNLMYTNAENSSLYDWWEQQFFVQLTKPNSSKICPTCYNVKISARKFIKSQSSNTLFSHSSDSSKSLNILFIIAFVSTMTTQQKIYRMNHIPV